MQHGAMKSKMRETVSSTSQRLLHSRADAAYILSISIRAPDYHIARQRIRVKHQGSKVLIHHSELIRFAKEDHPEAVSSEAEIAE